MRFPTEQTMMKAMFMSLDKDKPINMSFWISSLSKEICILYTFDKEYILSTSDVLDLADEYSSSIVERHRNGGDLICETENSLYIVSSDLAEKQERKK
jgi:hypothetical protein